VYAPYRLTSVPFRVVAYKDPSSAFFTPYLVTDINKKGVVLTGNMRGRKMERKL
jgi:hypothetical protein